MKYLPYMSFRHVSLQQIKCKDTLILYYFKLVDIRLKYYQLTSKNSSLTIFRY